jgi:hypothetical protein
MLRLSRMNAGIGLFLCCALRLGAAPALTTIQDTVYKADGTPLNGVVIVTWPSFVAADGSKIAAQTLTVTVPSGYFRIALVPTAGASSAVAYSVRINSAGRNESTELWSVPQSSSPLRIQDVMIAQTGGIIIGSGGGTPPGGGTAIQITDVVGLSNQLVMRPMMGSAFSDLRVAVINATGGIDGAAGNASDCLHVDGSSSVCGGSGSTTSAYVDVEVPAGTMNGSNTQFTLASTPVSSSSVSVWRNGLFLKTGVDFTVSARVITFAGVSTPQSGDTVLASYRTSAVAGITFVDAETPTGVVNGVNASFTLASSPNPTSSLFVYRNGLRQANYALSGNTITFTAGQSPQTGDTLVCSYRR